MDFFSKDQFYSTLRKSCKCKEYGNSKKLYELLKMRDLSDLNNLYNAQDTIMGNRFETMREKTI